MFACGSAARFDVTDSLRRRRSEAGVIRKAPQYIGGAAAAEATEQLDDVLGALRLPAEPKRAAQLIQ